jgi:hypothetical protein
MIRGVHTMFYSSQAEELRAFLRDKVQLSFMDVGEGWLIFDLPEADMGVHPTDKSGPASGTADVSFYCDDIRKTMKELKGRGVEFTQEVAEQEWGYLTFMKVPGNFQVMLYQPKYEKKS